MSDTTKLTIYSPATIAMMGARRGDYLTLTGYETSHATLFTGWDKIPRSTPPGSRRIVAANANTLTVRNVSSPRLVEWLRARFENYIAWPLADFKSLFREIRR